MTQAPHTPLLEMQGIEKHFGNIIALSGVSFSIFAGECHCLLGDNGAGKSTFIKTMSGVHAPTRGTMRVNNQAVVLQSPREAMNAGIATVFQDLAMIPLMCFACSRRRMGAQRIGTFLMVAGWASCLLITALDIYGLPDALRDAWSILGRH